MRGTVVRCERPSGERLPGGSSRRGIALCRIVLGILALWLGPGPGVRQARAQAASQEIPQGLPPTLEQALVAAYETNPQLLQERANVRAVDENVPKALSGWRPTVVLNGSGGYTAENERTT